MTNLHSFFPDGEVYMNPFHALLELGRDWAAEGMDVEEITAAAQQLGGVALGRNGQRNLTGFATEIIDNQSRTGQGEQ